MYKPLFNSLPISTTINSKRFTNSNNNNGCILQLKSYSDATMPYFKDEINNIFMHLNYLLLSLKENCLHIIII